MPELMITPPYSTLEPVTEVFHGVPVTDPYRWLEDQDSPRTRKWLEDQVAYTRRCLDSIAGRERARARLQELLSIDSRDVPQKTGNQLFFLKREASQEQPVITVRNGLDGQDTPLVNPVDLFGDRTTSVDIVSVSKHANLLAFSIRRGGEDFQAIAILDIQSGELLRDHLPRGICRGFVFSDDSSGFFYCHEEGETTNKQRHKAFWHALGTNSANDVEVFSASSNLDLQVSLVGSAGSRYVGFLVRRCSATRSYDFHVQSKRLGTPHRRVAESIEGRFVPRFVGDSLVCFISSGQDNGRIVAINLARPEPCYWRTVVPESHAKIHDFQIANQRVFVRYVENAESSIKVVDLSGQQQGELHCLKQGTARLYPCDPESQVVFYQLSSFTQPQIIRCYECLTGSDRVWWSKQIPFDTSAFEVTRQHCTSKDGTKVPVYLLSPRPLAASRALPTLLTAYGGFGKSFTPEFSIFGNFMVERGCIFAIAGIRGGSEFGNQWHQSAKRHNRQRSIDDFLAVSEWLFRNGFTAQNRLAIAGGSNGGLLVGAAMTQRPSLFRVVMCLGPLLDMLRYHHFDAATKWIEEYGCAEDSEDFASLLGYSPYHNVTKRTAYPAAIFVSGDSDTRCNPMHSRKMVARLQAASISGHAVILDYKTSWGHMPAQPLQTRIEVLTDRLSFLCGELGVEL
jgi:prolyl oligopeptidase